MLYEWVLADFKGAMVAWLPDELSCMLLKAFIQQFGLVVVKTCVRLTQAKRGMSIFLRGEGFAFNIELLESLLIHDLLLSVHLESKVRLTLIVGSLGHLLLLMQGRSI